MLIPVRFRYKGQKWQRKSPANVDLQGFQKVRSTGLEFVFSGLEQNCIFHRMQRNQRFHGSCILNCITAFCANSGTVPVQFRYGSGMIFLLIFYDKQDSRKLEVMFIKLKNGGGFMFNST